MEKQQRAFDEELLSGYLDGMLTQQEQQRVRLHLESDPAARTEFEQLREMRSLALSTHLRIEDEQWNERPRNGLSRACRFVGLVLIGAWALGLLIVTLWLPETLNAQQARWLTGSMAGGVGLVLVSALADRLHSSRTDIYRRVQK